MSSMLANMPLMVLQDHGFIVLAIGATILGLLFRAYAATDLPRELSLIREKPKSKHFSITTRLAFYLHCSSLYRDIWYKFSKIGLPVLVPTLGIRKDVFLPHSSIKWLLSQPSSVLGMWEAFNEMFQLGHSLGHEKYMLDTWAVDVARHVLTKDLDTFIEPVREEMQLAVDELLRADTENWQTVDLLDTMRMIINRVGSRFVVGKSLCRDEGYLSAAVTSLESIVVNAGVTGFMPPFLRPLFGRLACWNTQKVLQDLETRCSTMLEDRFAHIAANPDDESQDPSDLLQRMLRRAQHHRASEMTLDQMTRRLVMANLGFIYQASFAASNMLRNILESDQEHDTVRVLRDEAQRFSAAAGNDPSRLWTRQNIANMVCADSVARESLRLNTVPTRALVRQVMVDGLHTDTGVPLPRGALVSFVSQPMHTDPDHFPNPHAFEPFRFAQLRQDEAEAEAHRGAHPSDASVKATEDAGGSWSPHAFLSTANLLIFGRGRNSCPGRYLVDFQLKMLISHLLSNYDIKFADGQESRPESKWLLEFIYPQKGIKMMVKRRVVGE
ncbi:hypothetical protein Daus18300_013014 [Diaporthe australafricana]|uniref:Cytochrome P450 n=1 Tax=Diaporthe australafricana TaxID=127596 RepID=A0ABR3W0N3_9PEZI